MAAVMSAQSASAFAATLAGALRPASAVAATFAFPPSPLTRVETDRAVSIARAVSRNGNMMLTASEASLVCRYLLYALNVEPDS